MLMPVGQIFQMMPEIDFIHGTIPAYSTAMIRKLKTGGYRLYSRKVDSSAGKRRNLGTFSTREDAEKHERAVQFFKRAH